MDWNSPAKLTLQVSDIIGELHLCSLCVSLNRSDHLNDSVLEYFSCDEGWQALQT